MSTDSTLTFRCSECEETVLVNHAMRSGFIEHGCVFCGAPAEAGDFT